MSNNRFKAQVFGQTKRFYMVVVLVLVIVAFLISAPVYISRYSNGAITGTSQVYGNRTFFRSDTTEFIFRETYRYCLQFFLIALVGGILLQEYNRLRQRSVDFKEFRKDIYKALVREYLKVKKVRWNLRCNCSNWCINFSLYKEEMDKLVEVKSQLEVIQHEIEAFRKAFTRIEGPLKKNLEEMESYLRNILKEFKAKASVMQIDDGKVNISGLEHLINFLSNEAQMDNERRGSHFTLRFRQYFRQAIEMIKKHDLVELEGREHAYFTQAGLTLR